jgi:hypothetical protein
MNLFHKVCASLRPFCIPFATCLFTINTATNGCTDAFESSILPLGRSGENVDYLTQIHSMTTHCYA